MLILFYWSFMQSVCFVVEECSKGIIFLSASERDSGWYCYPPDTVKGGKIRDTKTLNLSRNIVSLQVLGRCFAFFTLCDQLVAHQKHLLRVEESCCEK